jgi:antitoxin ParD1/3/4
LASGSFASASEVIRAGLRLLEREEQEQEQEQEEKLHALRAAIEKGIASGRAKDSSMKGVLAEARARRK